MWSVKICVNHNGVSTVALKDVLNLVTQHEPQIVDAVVPQRHANYRRKVIEPETRAIDLRGPDGFDDHVADATFS